MIPLCGVLGIRAGSKVSVVNPPPGFVTRLNPLPDGVEVTDFDRHADIFDATYLWAREAIAALEAGGNPAIAAILGSKR